MSSIRLSQNAVLFALCLSAVSLGGCGKEVVDFNNNLAKSEQHLKQPMVDVMRHFETFGETGKIDEPAAEKDYTALVAAVDSAAAEVKAVKVIEAEKAAEFRDAYLKFYADLRTLVTTEIRKGLDVMKDKEMPAEQKDEQFRSIAEKYERDLNMATLELRSGQLVFADANGMNVEK